MYITIGLEIHFRLNTRSKLFSFSVVQPTIKQQNVCVGVLDLAFPGTLPMLNKRAVFLAIKFGLSINAIINIVSLFERKHYIYPDLPKGFQITQFKQPILKFGYIDIPVTTTLSKRVFVRSSHLEEDTAKLYHGISVHKFCVDFNRCGFPLLEVVTEPVLNTAQETFIFLKKLHELITALGLCSNDMETGSFRCDVNISLRKFFSVKRGVRVEIKNINSFKFVEKAIIYEIERQKRLLLTNFIICSETRFYNQRDSITYSLRYKETQFDYRYFSEPDIPAIVLTKYVIFCINFLINEYPCKLKDRFFTKFKLSKKEVAIFAQDKWFVEYFELITIYTKEYYLLLKILLNNFLTFFYSIRKYLIKPYLVGSVLNLLVQKKITTENLILAFSFFSKSKVCFHFSYCLDKGYNDIDFYNYILKHIFIIFYLQLEQYLLGNEKVIFFFIGKIKMFYKKDVNYIDLKNFLDK